MRLIMKINSRRKINSRNICITIKVSLLEFEHLITEANNKNKTKVALIRKGFLKQIKDTPTYTKI